MPNNGGVKKTSEKKIVACTDFTLLTIFSKASLYDSNVVLNRLCFVFKNVKLVPFRYLKPYNFTDFGFIDIFTRI